jgi:hypothetical protein
MSVGREDVRGLVLRERCATGDVGDRVYVTPNGSTAKLDCLADRDPASHKGIEKNGVVECIAAIEAIPEVFGIVQARA